MSHYKLILGIIVFLILFGIITYISSCMWLFFAVLIGVVIFGVSYLVHYLEKEETENKSLQKAKTNKSKKTKSVGNPWTYILLGVIFFILKYIPFIPLFEQSSGLNTSGQIGNMSINSAAKLCNSLVGQFATRCNWIDPVSILMLIMSIGFVLYGLFLFYKRDK